MYALHGTSHTFLNIWFAILPICRSILQISISKKINDLKIIIFFTGHLPKVLSVDGKECTTPLDTGLHWPSSVWCTPFSNWSLEQTQGLVNHAVLFCLLFVKTNHWYAWIANQWPSSGRTLVIFFFLPGWKFQQLLQVLDPWRTFFELRMA